MDFNPVSEELVEAACAELWPRLAADLSYDDRLAIVTAIEKGVGHALMRGYKHRWQPDLRITIRDRWRDQEVI